MYHQLPQSRVYNRCADWGLLPDRAQQRANPMREALKMIDEFMQETMTSPFQKGIYRQQQLAECYWSSRSAASYGPSFFYIATIVANTEENCVPQTF